MCICAYVVVRVWLMFVHMCVKMSCENVMFEVYGGENESKSDQWKFFFCF